MGAKLADSTVFDHLGVAAAALHKVPIVRRATCGGLLPLGGPRLSLVLRAASEAVITAGAAPAASGSLVEPTRPHAARGAVARGHT